MTGLAWAWSKSTASSNFGGRHVPPELLGLILRGTLNAFDAPEAKLFCVIWSRRLFRAGNVAGSVSNAKDSRCNDVTLATA
jgi:hypothetical protein